MRVLVKDTATVQLTQDAADAAGAVNVRYLPVSGGRGLADAGDRMGYALDVVQGEVHIRRLCGGQDVQDGVGGSAHGHIHGHGVFKGLLGGDGTRQDRVVVILVVPVGNLDDQLAGPLEEHLPGCV